MSVHKWLVGLVGVVLAASVARAEWVTIGNPGNDPDTRYDATGFGSVSYAYRIGMYEVSTGQYTAFLNAVVATDNYGLYDIRMWADYPYACKIQQTGNSGSYTYSVAEDYRTRPVNYVSWYDAARFCNWMTTGDTESGVYIFSGGVLQSIMDHQTAGMTYGEAFFLPTEDEWYKAAYYDPNRYGPGLPGYWDYPTGTSSPPGRDMNETTNPGNNANYYNWDDNPYPIDSGTYFTTRVGQFSLSHSPYGTFDQGGNVWEWNETEWEWHLGEGPFLGVLGGSFNDLSDNSLACYRYNFCARANDNDFRLGFRVASIAAVPEPGSVVMLAAGLGIVAALGYVWRRRRRR